MDSALLDTDILNEVLKQKNSQVVRHASAYLQDYGQFAWLPGLRIANWRKP